jgi:hypothetical protein
MKRIRLWNNRCLEIGLYSGDSLGPVTSTSTQMGAWPRPILTVHFGSTREAFVKIGRETGSINVTVPNETAMPTRNGSRHAAAKIIGGGIFLAVLSSLALLLSNLASYSSSLAAFEEIKLAMTRRQVQWILSRYERSCGSVPSNSTTAGKCQFSDFWRVYELVFDPTTDRLESKRFYFRKR